MKGDLNRCDPRTLPLLPEEGEVDFEKGEEQTFGRTIS